MSSQSGPGRSVQLGKGPWVVPPSPIGRCPQLFLATDSISRRKAQLPLGLALGTQVCTHCPYRATA